MEYFIILQVNTIKLYKSYMEESHRCDIEQRKPSTKEYIKFNSIYIKFTNRIVVTFGKEVIEGMRRGFQCGTFHFLTFVPVI